MRNGTCRFVELAALVRMRNGTCMIVDCHLWVCEPLLGGLRGPSSSSNARRDLGEHPGAALGPQTELDGVLAKCPGAAIGPSN